MKRIKLKPSTLRLVLIAALLIIIVSHGLVAVFGRSFLTESSEKVTQAVTLSSSSKQTLDRLSSAEQQLASQHTTVERSRSLVAPKDNHSYQEIVIRDINRYAQAAGVSVKNFTFNSNSATPGGAPKPKTEAEAKAAAAKTISGLKIETVTVTLESPIEFSTFFHFLRLIEGNILQMRLQSLNLSGGRSGGPEADASKTTIDSPAITLEVYTRS